MVYLQRNLKKSILVFAFVLLAGCSWTGIRIPSTISKTPAITIDDALTINSSNKVGEKDYHKYFIDYFISEKYNNKKFDFIQKENLPNQAEFIIEFDVFNDNYTYRIFHKKEAFKDLGALYALGNILNKFAYSPPLDHPLAYFEMYYNAKAGDPIALDDILKIREASFLEFDPPFDEDLSEYFTSTKQSLSKMREKLIPEIKALKSERKTLKLSRKEILESLDKATEDEQFRSLVATGDRKGVADLIQKYLPFEDFAPFETKFWKTYLEVLRNPVPLDQRVLVYRGLDDDILQAANVDGVTLSKEDAIEKSKVFVMSSVLAKNQGSWNRRLRSLEAMNEKYIAITSQGNKEFAESARITTMFVNHSITPQGSPFISFSPKLEIAARFGHDQHMSALIDPRLIHFNFLSTFKEEIEFLLPLVTFPDEMVGLWTQKENLGGNEFFDEKLLIRITEEYGKGKAKEIIKRIEKNTADLFSKASGTGHHNKAKVSGPNMAEFYKTFAKGKDIIKPPMTPKGDLTCKDLLKIFWKVPQ